MELQLRAQARSARLHVGNAASSVVRSLGMHQALSVVNDLNAQAAVDQLKADRLLLQEDADRYLEKARNEARVAP